jgi:tetratricopeptide (TPR) repeat protein
MSNQVDALEKVYGVSLSQRYRDFLQSGEHARHDKIVLAGYIRGPYDLDFTDALLADVGELGVNAGISDMDDVPWSSDYAGFVPLASMSHPEVDEPKMFLVLDGKKAEHPVLLFDHEGWTLYRLADSFEAFLAKLPAAEVDLAARVRPGAESEAEEDVPRYQQPPHGALWDASLKKAYAADYDGALADLQQLVTALPDEPRVHRAIAQMYGELKRNDEALAAIDRALALDGGILYVISKAEILVDRKEHAAAEALLANADALTRDDGDRATLLGMRAVLDVLQGRSEAEAIKKAQAARAIDIPSLWSDPWKGIFDRLVTGKKAAAEKPPSKAKAAPRKAKLKAKAKPKAKAKAKAKKKSGGKAKLKAKVKAKAKVKPKAKSKPKAKHKKKR